MKAKTIHFVPFIVTCGILALEFLAVLFSNLMTSHPLVSYLIPDTMLLGALFVAVVGLSILLKRNIWVYLFTVLLALSYAGLFEICSISIAISIGAVKLDLIILPLLITHIWVNNYAFSIPSPTPKEEKESESNQIQFFIKRFERKSSQELLDMNESELVPEAQEARRILLDRFNSKDQ